MSKPLLMAFIGRDIRHGCIDYIKHRKITFFSQFNFFRRGLQIYSFDVIISIPHCCFIMLIHVWIIQSTTVGEMWINTNPMRVLLTLVDYLIAFPKCGNIMIMQPKSISREIYYLCSYHLTFENTYFIFFKNIYNGVDNRTY